MHQLPDRATNPSPQDVSQLHNKWREQHLGPENGEEMFKALEFIAEYNIWHKDDGDHIFVQPYCATNDKMYKNLPVMMNQMSLEERK